MVLNILEVLDIFLLILLMIFISFYLYKNRSRLKKEGILYLYKTSWGLKLIQKTGSKYKKTLYFLSYISIFLGYILMISIVYFFIKIVFNYITRPEIVQTIKAPPIAPVIPYFPKLFGLSGMFPNFYGIYFVISIAIVAIVHEFSHGIFAQRYGIKIKTTGFAFLKYFPAIFGAFVEQDDKQMTKKRNFEQMSVLSAGVFANIITMILFIILLIGFYSVAFTPTGGAVFYDYSFSKVYASEITLINNQSFNNPTYEEINKFLNQTKEIDLISNGKDNYIGFRKIGIDDNGIYLQLYQDSPAINSKLKGGIFNYYSGERIIEINSERVLDTYDFSEKLLKYSPGDEINIKVKTNQDYEEYNITLSENPLNKSQAYLGVVSIRGGNYIINELNHYFSSLNPQNLYLKQGTYYEPKIPGFSEFIYYLFWWIIILNFSVALINMLPVGIFDGGRFFYLTILSITGNKKIAEKSFKLMTSGFLALLVILMIFWLIGLLFY